jgi:hypothetical protein
MVPLKPDDCKLKVCGGSGRTNSPSAEIVVWNSLMGVGRGVGVPAGVGVAWPKLKGAETAPQADRIRHRLIIEQRVMIDFTGLSIV